MINFVFDPATVKFWELNQALQFYDHFYTIYKGDRTSGKHYSRRLALAACVIWHRKSPYLDLPEGDRINIVENNIFGEVGFFNQYRDELFLLKASLEKSKSLLERMLADTEDKIVERALYIKTTPYNDPINGGQKLDNLILNTTKVIDEFSTIRKRVQQEEQDSEGIARGGGERSATESGKI